MEIPAHLQSTFDLLTRAFGDELTDHDYLPLIAVLGEHMCEENLAMVIALRFGRDTYQVANDLAKTQSTEDPSVEARESIRSLLLGVGLAEWLAEDE